MTFGGQVRLAGAVVVIIGAVANTLILNLIGLMIVAVGMIWQIDALEKRVALLEPKENLDDEN